MGHLTSKQIRQIFIDFFKNKNHFVLDSKPLLPLDDDSLLLINSGIATLKKYFTHQEIPPNNNLVNSQKCVRTNDIENVGLTNRHLTFFEMLGNFSIGGYFKKQAIGLAYEFLFEILKLPKKFIYITYHKDDKLTYELWKSKNINPLHLIAGDNSTNFWDLGHGPCGPNTEIFYDLGEDYDYEKKGLKLLRDNIENDRYLEIWNIVFSEFNNDGANNYQELPKKNIDTGIGFERLVSVLQRKDSIFETDLFYPMIQFLEKITNLEYQNKKREFRVIVDHFRSIALLISDGLLPSNQKAGYILRKLIRRVMVILYKINISILDIGSFCLNYLKSNLDLYEIKYDLVIEVLKKENDLFYNTIKIGEKKVAEFLKKEKFINTEIAFKLYETYGFPLEIIKEIVDSSLIKIDAKVFETLKQTHSQVSKSITNLGLDMQFNFLTYANNKLSQFVGYEYDEIEAKVMHQIYENNNYYVLLNKTPFYATKGGQHSDFGWIDNKEVLNVISDKYENHWHVLKDKINKDKVIAKVDPIWRINAMRNHSATHLLGSAIYELYGKTIQIGSDNNPNRLTLDFFLDHKPNFEEIKKIEDKVNTYIKKNYKREYIETTIENAKEMGAWLFENKLDKYNKKVRVVKFGNISKELCGGTHIPETKLIEKFKIIKLDSKGINKYRIEAITSFKKIEKYEQMLFDDELKKFTYNLKNIKNIIPNFEYNNNFKNYKDIQKVNVELAKKYKKLIKDKNSQILYTINESNFKKIINYDTYVDLNIKSNDLKKLALFLKEKLPNKIILVGKKEGNNTLIAIASNDGKALEIFNHIIMNNKGGNGGGNPYFAMGKINQVNLNLWENSPLI